MLELRTRLCHNGVLESGEIKPWRQAEPGQTMPFFQRGVARLKATVFPTLTDSPPERLTGSCPRCRAAALAPASITAATTLSSF
jgi:hypothetical protein